VETLRVGAKRSVAVGSLVLDENEQREDLGSVTIADAADGKSVTQQ
jgi:hypothetical protein